MVSAVSRSANSQNTVQPADFSANEPFHVAVETLANDMWTPDSTGRWFYERARGSYRAARMALASDAAAVRRFLLEAPKDRVFTKTDLAKCLNAWNCRPHLVSHGSQKNFHHFMQALRDEYSNGFRPDEKWYRDFIAKLIIFRTAQDLVKAQKFAAYQAIITAYTVACIADRYEAGFDLELVWSKQSISSQLSSLIQRWALAIGGALRRTAGARMPSEWAKRLECWDSIREGKLETPFDPPPEIESRPIESDQREPDPLENIAEDQFEGDIGSLILRVRSIFARDDSLAREDFVVKIADILGYPPSDAKAHQDTEILIRAAVRRGVMEETGGRLSLVARTISDYPREMLKEQFLASLNGNAWTERSESIPRFARWLGFKRTGPNIEDAAKSAINSLIRAERLEKMGSQIRRI
jgi:hypothetical protein